MSDYATATDLNNLFGSGNISAWSNLANDSEDTPDTARIALAIVNAQQEIDDRFRQSMYVVPFSATGTNGLIPITKWCAQLAGVWLYMSRLQRGNEATDPNTVLVHRRAALEEMDNYLAGTRSLACARKAYCTTAPFIV